MSPQLGWIMLILQIVPSYVCPPVVDEELFAHNLVCPAILVCASHDGILYTMCLGHHVVCSILAVGDTIELLLHQLFEVAVKS